MATLDHTTIQRFAAQKIGGATASVNDLVALLRDGAEGRIGATVRDAVRWTKERFSRPLASRKAAADLVFLPDPRTEGFRWDNWLNWSTGDLPGAHAGDTVDLDGNTVRFGTLTASVAALSCGTGRLDVTSGRLALGTTRDPLDAVVRLSGQLAVGATAQPVRIAADSGRVSLTGRVSDLDLAVRGHAEALLVSGQRPLVGWDGAGSATLTIAGSLEFRAGIMLTVGNAAQKQRFMQTGYRIETPNFAATIADYEERSGGTNNRLFLCDLSGLLQPAEAFVFGNWPKVDDSVDSDRLLSATVTAIASPGIAPLQRFRSGAIGDGLTAPTVAASVVLKPGSAVVIGGREYLAPGTYDLT